MNKGTAREHIEFPLTPPKVGVYKIAHALREADTVDGGREREEREEGEGEEEREREGDIFGDFMSKVSEE